MIFELHQIDGQANALMIIQFAMDSILADPRTTQQVINFYAFTAEWLLSLVDPEQKGYVYTSPTGSDVLQSIVG